MVFLEIFAWAVLTWYVFVISLIIFGWITIWFIKSKNRIHDEKDLTEALPGVSILRPLKGLDPRLYECLESTFVQKYPKFEIILSVADETDPAVLVAKEVIKKYSKVDARIIIGDERIGQNPKINNLIRSEREAKYDILWILDSNIWISQGCIKRSVKSLMTPGVQLVHHLPVCIASSSRPSVGSCLDEMFLSTFHARMYSAINRIAVTPCVIGKSNLFRRISLLSRAPKGLKEFSNYIAEDHLIATTLWTRRKSHFMAAEYVWHPVDNIRISDYITRRIRWIRLRKYVVTVPTLVEPFTESILSGFLGVWSISILSNFRHAYILWIIHMFVWMVMDYTQFNILRSSLPSEIKDDSNLTPCCYNFFHWICIWVLREILAFPIWVIGISGSQIYWRNQTFTLRSDMTAQIVY
ncbi:hypothetical protein T552_01009 [Pneumocystis carinii B80]|uniref:Ceramide glucosyltransferase n=1 Tax=Pneumocystis carinii (strain B80) TaxID=1408658 RepID=A0A0W4ZN53_PNEC8|nr:hypothetical protein T552_01009 [Pneumocystis carinii B80]KTW29804.1 hypothetical protein T552_01009 [Pneumocystis carinii B80]